jgi:hypothetical protein
LNSQVFKPVIKYILAGLQETNYPVSYPEQTMIVQDYGKLIWGKEYDKKRYQELKDETIQRMLPELGEEGANRAARSELEIALNDANKQERELFNLLDPASITPTTNTQAALKAARLEAGKTGKGSIPDYAIRFFSKKSKKFLTDATTLKEMRNAQSELRRIARNAREGTDPNRNLARIADDIASAITDDLALAQGNSTPEDLANAINFSREKNTVFSRGSVGRI